MTDKIRVACPNCDARMRLTSSHIAGKTIRCPSCSELFVATGDAPTKVRAPGPLPRSNRHRRDESVKVFHEHVRPNPYGDPRAKPERPTDAPAEPPTAEQQPRKKKKRRKSSDVPQPSGPKMFLCGFIGGSLGGIAWIGFAYLLHVHLGIVAILVGVLTGIGVQTGNNGQDDHGPGEIAVFTAFAVILVCKYVVACLLTDRLLFGEDALKAFTFYDIIWCAVAGRWAYRVASGGLF
ncbi:MAG TPA: MJ0042-type zinc finger domain-containing protein [Planctomycetaceae bacterium]|nr:MJ0042-type zinc finger domain-containing protein [Planctomycetaceae bacterium]